MTGPLLVLGIVAAVLAFDLVVGYFVGRPCRIGDEIGDEMGAGERRVGPEGRERLP